MTRTIGRVSGPVLLVGHSYGGTLITAAGTDDRVAGLVYIAALAPDETEISQSQQDQFPATDVFNYNQPPSPPSSTTSRLPSAAGETAHVVRTLPGGRSQP